ncbi:hypothetical protein [Streptomyces coelicoflavus]|uniref:hypothetical protein n=1 Tax=Streptomyces coelicoflavus TaxID=285562 RepID=UPI002E253AC1
MPLRECGHSSHAQADAYPLTGRIVGTRCGGDNHGKGRETNCSDPYLTADAVEASMWGVNRRGQATPVRCEPQAPPFEVTGAIASESFKHDTRSTL